jgi:hypothetical protein
LTEDGLIIAIRGSTVDGDVTVIFDGIAGASGIIGAAVDVVTGGTMVGLPGVPGVIFIKLFSLSLMLWPK